MNLGEQKNWLIRLVIIALTLVAITTLAIINTLYLAFFVGYFFVVLFSKSEEKEKLIQFCIYSLLGFIILLIADFLILRNVFQEPYHYVKAFFYNSIFFLLSFVPIGMLEAHLKKVETISARQKERYKIVSKFPDLICDMHFTRTVEKSFLGHKIVRCRTSKKCFSFGRIIHARLLVGIIGDYRWSRLFEDEYSTMIWNNETKTIFDGDYDVIEIREGDEIEDYDGAVNKVIAFLYNQIKRYKPIDEIVIRIAGNPRISESTKRLLEERFLKVVYLELNYKKLNYTL